MSIVGVREQHNEQQRLSEELVATATQAVKNGNFSGTYEAIKRGGGLNKEKELADAIAHRLTNTDVSTLETYIQEFFNKRESITREESNGFSFATMVLAKAMQNNPALNQIALIDASIKQLDEIIGNPVDPDAQAFALKAKDEVETAKAVLISDFLAWLKNKKLAKVPQQSSKSV